MERVFTVPAGADAVWAVLSDLGRLAECVPGLVQAEPDGAAIAARLRLRVGSNQVTYLGRLAPHTADRAAGLIRIEGTGTEARGTGEVSTSVRIRLQDRDSGTMLTVALEADGSGRIAGFDPIQVRDAGGRLLDRFVAALSEQLPAAEVETKAPAVPALPAEPASAASSGTPVAPVPPVASASSAQWQPRAEQPLATVTSIAGAVAVRSRGRRATAVGAALLLAGILALWSTRRRAH